MTHSIAKAALYCLIITWAVLAIPADAALNGNTYSSLQHQVSFTRPDESWELRESPAKAHAVSVFSNGEGRAIALLLHIAVKPSEVVSSPIDLRDRWNQLASMIASSANAGEGNAMIETSRYDIVDGRIEFDVHYTCVIPGTSSELTNWVSGFILRDTQDRQHIFAVRCAAGSAVFDAWQTQFERITASLQYDDSRAATVYTDPPIPLWWWFGGAAIVIGIIFIATRRREAPMHRLKHPVTIPGMAPAGIGGLPPAQMGMPPFGGGVPNIPDQMLPAADLGAPADLSNVPDSVFYSAGANDQLPTAEQLGASPDFWKCSCGRVNPGSTDHCVRCDAVRIA